MSSINYFHIQYKREEPRTDILFGINDNGVLAYTTSSDESGIMEVTNKSSHSIQFTPVDHNIIVIENGNERSQCDGMLHIEVTKELIFIEMKDCSKDWISEAVNQLKSTIAHFSSNHVITDFNKRSAYAGNKQHPFFQHSKKELAETFRNQTKFRLNITNKVTIK
ncbi:MAG: hypothetical protein J6J26_05590 [Bacteroides sp.]|nr:hypothetical protein [Bacteroides sp.]